jgi:hypothetical protein
VGVFGNKAGMTQLFTPEGLCVPVTVIAIQAGNVVTQVHYGGRDICLRRSPTLLCCKVPLWRKCVFGKQEERAGTWAGHFWTSSRRRHICVIGWLLERCRAETGMGRSPGVRRICREYFLHAETKMASPGFTFSFWRREGEVAGTR